MKKLLIACATLPFILAAVHPATAQTADTLDQVAYLLVGVQDGKDFVLEGVPLKWAKTAPGKFAATSPDGITLGMSFTQTTSACAYRVDVDVAAGGKNVMHGEMHYDFAKITGMALVSPEVAEISGTDYCTSTDQSMCTSRIGMSIPTDAATFDRTYADFRAASCP